jgi:hypothetical protein
MKIEQNKEKLCRAIFFNIIVISLEIIHFGREMLHLAMCLISVSLLPVCVGHDNKKHFWIKSGVSFSTCCGVATRVKADD